MSVTLHGGCGSLWRMDEVRLDNHCNLIVVIMSLIDGSDWSFLPASPGENRNLLKPLTWLSDKEQG